jgi:hypothetical protein
MGATATITRAQVRGSYVLAAAPHDAIAHAPLGEPYTAFTGELIRLLDQGIAEGPEYFSLDFLSGWLSSELDSRGLSKPEWSDRNGIGQLPWLRNRAHRQPAAKSQVYRGPGPDHDRVVGIGQTTTLTEPAARTALPPAPETRQPPLSTGMSARERLREGARKSLERQDSPRAKQRAATTSRAPTRNYRPVGVASDAHVGAALPAEVKAARVPGLARSTDVKTTPGSRTVSPMVFLGVAVALLVSVLLIVASRFWSVPPTSTFGV